MRLLVHMRDNDIADDAMAARIGGCTAHAVKKWKYGEREPDATTMARIAVVTDGAVTLEDWVDQRADRAERARRPKSDAASVPDGAVA